MIRWWLGGTGGDTFSGRHHTEESKQKKREAMKRFYATKVWTDEERDRCRYWKGKHHTEEQKRKMSEVCKGINTGPKSEETKRKISQTLMGNIPWNKGIKMTEEQRLKQVEIKKKIYEGEKGEQIKQKLRDANVGNVWWNNGVIEVKSKEQPEGFLCGRINNHRNKWFTNGNVDIRFRSVVATFGSHGLLGVEDGVVFQLCPRGEGGVQVLLLPLLCLHEVGVTGVGVVHVGQRGNPSFGDSLVPTNLLHALLHLREHGFERLPTRVVVLLVDEDSFGGSASERCEDVEATGNGALGGFVIRIDHLVQHLGVGLVALGHEVDFVGAGGLELRTDARLLLGGLLLL